MDDTLIAQQGLLERIEDAALTIRETPVAESTDGKIASCFGVLDRYWSHLENNHVELPMSAVPRDHRYFTENDFAQAERSYIETQARFFDLQSSLHPTPIRSGPPADGQSRGATRLSRITILPFSGRREDWESFRDLFRSLIHDDPILSDVDKLYYC